LILHLRAFADALRTTQEGYAYKASIISSPHLGIALRVTLEKLSMYQAAIFT